MEIARKIERKISRQKEKRDEKDRKQTTFLKNERKIYKHKCIKNVKDKKIKGKKKVIKFVHFCLIIKI